MIRIGIDWRAQSRIGHGGTKSTENSTKALGVILSVSAVPLWPIFFPARESTQFRIARHEKSFRHRNGCLKLVVAYVFGALSGRSTVRLLAGLVLRVHRRDHVVADIDSRRAVEHVALIDQQANLIDVDLVEIVRDFRLLLGDHEIQTLLRGDLGDAGGDLVEDRQHLLLLEALDVGAS